MRSTELRPLVRRCNSGRGSRKLRLISSNWSCHVDRIRCAVTAGGTGLRWGRKTRFVSKLGPHFKRKLRVLGRPTFNELLAEAGSRTTGREEVGIELSVFLVVDRAHRRHALQDAESRVDRPNPVASFKPLGACPRVNGTCLMNVHLRLPSKPLIRIGFVSPLQLRHRPFHSRNVLDPRPRRAIRGSL